MASEHAGPVIAMLGHTTVINCIPCGFAHQDPILSEDIMERYYRSHFWQSEKADALRILRRQRKWWQETYGDWLSLLGEPGFLLDFGSGYGDFILAALAWACSPVTGIEPSHQASDHCESVGLHICRQDWQDFARQNPNGRAGIVSALWLLEHLTNPASFLHYAHHILRPDGHLLLVVPNEWTPLQEEANLFANKKEWWIHSSHINYFSWASITALLKTCSFEIVERFATYPMERFILAGRDYTDNPRVGRKAHREIERRDLSMSRSQRMEYYRQLGATGRGRDIVLVAVKR